MRAKSNTSKAKALQQVVDSVFNSGAPTSPSKKASAGDQSRIKRRIARHFRRG